MGERRRKVSVAENNLSFVLTDIHSHIFVCVCVFVCLCVCVFCRRGNDAEVSRLQADKIELEHAKQQVVAHLLYNSKNSNNGVNVCLHTI